MPKYLYEGPVLVFGKCVGNWRGETFAKSEEKAMSNLAYQFRKQNNRAKNTVVDFTNKLKVIY